MRSGRDKAASRWACFLFCVFSAGCIGPQLRRPSAPEDRSAERKGEPIAVRGESLIRDLAYVTYAIPPARLRRLVPDRFELLTRELGVGERAFLSLVWFRHDDLRACVPLSPEMDGAEINLRTYVRDRRTGEEGVWFLDLAFTPPVGALFNVGTGAAARQERARITSRRDDTGRRVHALNGTSLSARHRHGAIEDLGLGPGARPGFASGEELRAFLIDRHVGFYPRGRGQRGVGRMEVEHARLALRAGRLVSIRMPRAVALGLLQPEELERPHSAVLSEGARFRVYITRDVEPRSRRISSTGG